MFQLNTRTLIVFKYWYPKSRKKLFEEQTWKLWFQKIFKYVHGRPNLNYFVQNLILFLSVGFDGRCTTRHRVIHVHNAHMQLAIHQRIFNSFCTIKILLFQLQRCLRTMKFLKIRFAKYYRFKTTGLTVFKIC